MLKALAGLVQQFRRQSEVTLSGSDIDMAEVSRQLWQQALHIRYLAIPGDHTVDGGGVPQVMQSWLIAAAVMTQHAGPNSESAEEVLCRAARHRGGSACQEQCCVQCGGVLLGTQRHIGS